MEFISYKDTSVRLSGRWDTERFGAAVTTAPGGTIELAFCGTCAVLHFDTDWNEHPFPHLYISVDNGAKMETPLNRYLRIECETSGAHFITIVLKGAMEQQHRWHQPLVGKLSFLGYEAEKSGTLPQDDRRVIEFIGDSITEGVLNDAFYNDERINQKNRPNQDDVTATYAYLSARALGLKPVIMGYGAVGITKGGCGSVPKVIEAYPYNFSGSFAQPQNPDIIVINHGANDRGAKEEDYLTGYWEFLELVRKRNPASKIVVLSAFCGAFHEALGEMVKRFNKQKGEAVTYIDSYGWIPEEPLHPLRDGHFEVARHLIPELKKLL